MVLQKKQRLARQGRSGQLARFYVVFVLDLTTKSAALQGFAGGFTDGAYGYAIPHSNRFRNGMVARVNMQDFNAVAVLDLTPKNAALEGFAGGFTDGAYGYVAPHSNGVFFFKNGKLARFSLPDFSSSQC